MMPVLMQTSRNGGFRLLRVTAKIRESDTITSFHLSPVDASGWHRFEPGQFLVFRIPLQSGLTGQAGQMLRSYSVSCAPGRIGHYRITIKRETAAQAGVPDGLGSSFLHDRVQVGDVLMADGPRGEFVLDKDSTRPVVLLSGGVGLTPLVSMLHALASQSARRVVFVHACDNGSVHALGEEVRTIAASRNGIAAHIVYRFPSIVDKEAARHQDEGVITREILQKLLSIDDYDFYLCGPPPFMQAVYALVRSLGVAKERIAYEFFGPAAVLDVDVAAAPPDTVFALSQAATDGTSGGEFQIRFQKSARITTWTPDSHSLLEFAESHGLSPNFSCRAGVCGTCRTDLLQGRVNYFEEPLDAVEEGHVLLCCARPAGSIILDL